MKFGILILCFMSFLSAQETMMDTTRIPDAVTEAMPFSVLILPGRVADINTSFQKRLEAAVSGEGYTILAPDTIENRDSLLFPDGEMCYDRTCIVSLNRYIDYLIVWDATVPERIRLDLFQTKDGRLRNRTPVSLTPTGDLSDSTLTIAVHRLWQRPAPLVYLSRLSARNRAFLGSGIAILLYGGYRILQNDEEGIRTDIGYPPDWPVQ